MELFWLIANLLLAVYSFYAWRKYADRESFWLGFLGSVIVFLLATKLFLANLFPEEIRSTLRILVYYSWLPVFAGLGSMLLKQTKARYILYGILFVLFIFVTYLMVVGINGVHLQP
jgi:hypothetical protein